MGDMSRPDRLGQHPFRATSVFNFYRPQYVAPGTEAGAAGVTAPELQIVNESTSVGYVNTMSRYARDDTPMKGSADEDDLSFSPDYTRELSLADNPEALVDHLDLLLTYGRMAAETRDRILTVLNDIPIREDRAEEDLEDRVHIAVMMATTSTEYIVQR